MTDSASSDRYGTADEEVDIERVRLEMLAAARDPRTIGVLERLDLPAEARCWEIGAGSGSVSTWLAGRVATVLSTDIDLQFHADMPANVTVLRHDVENDDLPDERFDLIHARAVMQHLPERESVIAALVSRLAPKGWLVLEDSSFLGFAQQSVPAAYAPIHAIVSAGSQEEWRDPDFGLQLLDRLRNAGLTDLDVDGDLWAMRPGEPGGEWWFLALERAIPRLVEFGLIDAAQGEQAMAEVRAPGFVMLSPVSIAAWGRRAG